MPRHWGTAQGGRWGELEEQLEEQLEEPGHEWNAEDFKKRLEKAKLTKDRAYIKSILKEARESRTWDSLQRSLRATTPSGTSGACLGDTT